MGFLGDFLSGGVEGVGNAASKIIGNFKADPTEIAKAQHELKMITKEYAMKDKERKLKDKMSARDMYKNDSSLQKIFALTFLVGYIGITGFLLYFLITNNFAALGAYAAGLISSIFTAMSTKVATICDFLFGGSTPPEKPMDFVSIQKEQEKEQLRKLKRKCKSLGLEFDDDATVDELQELLDSKKKQ